MKPTPTIEEFKAWAKAHHADALLVCKAMAFAQMEKERVDSYIMPLFRQFDFREPANCETSFLQRPCKTTPCRIFPTHGERITNPASLYLAPAEQTAHYYTLCDLLHREHGFTGPFGQCPALVAESLQRDAERILLDAGCELMGLSKHPYGEDGKDRQKFLDILIGACLKAGEEKEPHPAL